MLLGDGLKGNLCTSILYHVPCHVFLVGGCINSYINITIIIYILVLSGCMYHPVSSVKHLVAKNVSNVNINMSIALPKSACA